MNPLNGPGCPLRVNPLKMGGRDEGVREKVRRVSAQCSKKGKRVVGGEKDEEQKEFIIGGSKFSSQPVPRRQKRPWGWRSTPVGSMALAVPAWPPAVLVLVVWTAPGIPSSSKASVTMTEAREHEAGEKRGSVRHEDNRALNKTSY